MALERLGSSFHLPLFVGEFYLFIVLPLVGIRDDDRVALLEPRQDLNTRRRSLTDADGLLPGLVALDAEKRYAATFGKLGWPVDIERVRQPLELNGSIDAQVGARLWGKRPVG